MPDDDTTVRAWLKANLPVVIMCLTIGFGGTSVAGWTTMTRMVAEAGIGDRVLSSEAASAQCAEDLEELRDLAEETQRLVDSLHPPGPRANAARARIDPAPDVWGVETP